MLHRRLTCPIRDRHAPSETDMPHRRPTFPIGDMPAESNRNFNSFKYSYFHALFFYLYILEYYIGPLGNVGLRWVSDEAYWGLWWVPDKNNIFVNSNFINKKFCFRHCLLLDKWRTPPVQEKLLPNQVIFLLCKEGGGQKRGLGGVRIIFQPCILFKN